MRALALVLVLLGGPLVACSGGGDASDASAAATSELTECAVAYEDRDLVVFRGEPAPVYVPKTLHVVEMRITPAIANSSGDWIGSPFYTSRIDYVLGARADDAAITRASAKLGAALAPAKVAFDATTASVTTGIAAGTSRYSTPDDKSTFVAELVDEWPDGSGPRSGSGPLLGASLHRGLLVTAKARARISCGGGTATVDLAAAPPVAFDVAKARTHVPDRELDVIGDFMAIANTIRVGHYRSTLVHVGSADLAAKMTAFADLVDREVRPAAKDYEVTMTLDQLKVHVATAWSGYLALASEILATTKARHTVDDMFVKTANGWDLALDLPSDAQVLLAFAGVFRVHVEELQALGATEWSATALVP